MSKFEKTMSFDYSFFISMTVIGGIFASAAVMIGIGAGVPDYGYYGAGVILFFTAFILLIVIRKARLNIPLFVPKRDALNNEKIGVPMLMTSLAGDVVYSNKAAKSLFEKYDFGEPQSPLKINLSNKNSIKETLDKLDIGKMGFAVSEVGDTGKYLRFEVERVQHNGDFHTWRIFEGAEPDDVFGNGFGGADGYLNIGKFLDNSEIGFIVINDNGRVVFTNGYLSKQLFEDGDIPEYPFKLSNISSFSHKNLTGKVRFISNKGNTIEANVNEMQNVGDGNNSYYFVMNDGRMQSDEKSDSLQVSVDNNFYWNSPIGVAVIGSNGDIYNKNSVFGNFVSGLELGPIENINQMLQDENASLVLKEIDKTVKTAKASEMVELRLKGESSNQGKFYITSAGAVSDQNTEVIIYLIDITEQKKLELQFSQSQKMQAVGQLAGGVAHDFNNLLTAITGFCDLLLVKHGPGDQSFSDIIQIKQNANRAANLVRQLLAFSRQQTLRPKVLIMTDVVAELSNLLRRLIGSNIDLKMNHGRNIEPVRVDQGQLEQVIINLCVNARDAMPDGGKLEIRTKNISIEDSLKVTKEHKIFPQGEYVLLEVIDNGTGIAKEHLNKVFEPFFSTKDIGKGTGLGLSTVYGIIKQTNGFVFPDSEVGVGTAFKIYLPRYIKEETDEEEDKVNVVVVEEKARDLTGSSTILLVEDEDAVRMFASRALKNKGYTVYEADSGVSALKLMEETDAHLDLLISDVMMPQMDGPSLVRKIRETDKDLKVIFISGYAEDALDDNIMDKDFNFLSKPFSLKQLAEQVKEVLEK